jgi:transcriptional regulator with XRE-family HTH domain
VDLYNRIDELCKGKGLSIYKVCKLANISFSVIYDLKSGKKVDLNRKTAEKLATALEITVDELYGKEKTPDAEAPRDIQNAKFNELLATLPAEEQQKVYDYLQFVADKYKHR